MSDTSLCDQAYNYIFNRITNFSYKPNDPIIENEIGRELSISRTPLREALRRLESDGLVYKIKNRGTYVRGFTYEDVVEICEIREMFELYALKICVERVEKEDLWKIRDMLNALTKDSPADLYYQSDVRLHNLIMRYCLNTKMITFLESLNSQLEVFRRMSGSMPMRLDNSKEEHLQIISLIEERNYDKAKEALSSHLENVKKHTILAFQNMKYCNDNK